MRDSDQVAVAVLGGTKGGLGRAPESDLALELPDVPERAPSRRADREHPSGALETHAVRPWVRDEARSVVTTELAKKKAATV
jgi:hypothetical protein